MESRNMAPPGDEPGLNRERSQRNPTEQPAGQQAVNAALAALDKTGDAFALGQLWQINRGLLRSLFWKWYPAHRELADAHGLTADDFEQEGYFAVQYAAQTFNPEAGSFSTWLGQAMQRQIARALTGGHRRNITDADGKRHTISADPLNHCSSLDMPLDVEDDGAATLADLQPDPAADRAMQAVEDCVYHQQLHDALENALDKLTVQEREIIRRKYYGGQSLLQIGQATGISYQRVQQIKTAAFRKLRRNPRLLRWHDEVLTTHAWRGTSFDAWAYGGSVEERAVEYLESKGAYIVEETSP